MSDVGPCFRNDETINGWRSVIIHRLCHNWAWIGHPAGDDGKEAGVRNGGQQVCSVLMSMPPSPLIHRQRYMRRIVRM